MSGFLHAIKRWLRRRSANRQAEALARAHVGPHSHVDASVHVLGWNQVRVGHHSIISADTWLNVNNRHAADPAIVIGDNCFIGRRNFMSSGELIRIGDYCLTGVDCHFLGSDHIYSDPFVPYVVTGTTLDAAIEIGANCWLGASVTVVGRVRVGFGSIIGAGSVVTRDVPPFSVVVGNPARVIKRFDVRAKLWIKAADWTPEAEAALPAEPEYLAGLHASHPTVKGPRIASSKAFGDL